MTGGSVNKKLTGAFLVSALMMNTTQMAFAQQVTLRTVDGQSSMQGVLLPGEADVFVIETAVGIMRISKSDVECLGAACPVIVRQPADVIVHGSDTIGDKLFPLLVQGYAEALNATVTNTEDLGDTRTELQVYDAGGFGNRVLTVEVQAAGSSTGLRSLIDGTADIGMSSRPVTPEEIAAIAQQGRGDLLDLSQEYIVAVDSILAIVSPNNPVSDLTVGQMSDIFSGRVRNWADVGGPDLPITVYTRDAESGTRGVFTSQILAPAGVDMSATAVVVGGNEQMAQQVVADIGGIGYVGFASLGDAKSVNLIASCGIKMVATEFAAKTEEYPLERRLRLFTDNNPKPRTQNLLDFSISPSADILVREAGFIDLGVSVRENYQTTMDLNAQEFIDEPAALSYLSEMVSTLSNAERLSTTFRFEIGSAVLDNKAQRDIVRVVEYLKRPENAAREVVFVGYSDDVGAFELNGALSSSRADTTLRAVLSHPDARQMDRTRFRAAGFGELAPVACNDDEDGRRRNRRVELWLR